MGRLLRIEQNRNILSRHNPGRNILYDRIVVHKRLSANGQTRKNRLREMTSASHSGTDMPVAMSAISTFPSGVEH